MQSRDSGGVAEGSSGERGSSALPCSVRPAFAWCDGELHRGWRLDVGPRGLVERLGPDVGSPPYPAVECPNRALLPGFVNAHSHAFQRLIRGATHRRVAERDDFWSWRQAMYSAAASLDPDTMRAVAACVFVEMLEAGFTTVGEFHYLHHRPSGAPYDEPHAMANALADAAVATGIRMRLLRVVYLRGGLDGRALEGGQRRFGDSSLDASIRAVVSLRDAWVSRGEDRLSVGVAPHSVRAVGPAALRELAGWARAEEVPLHIHAAEQPAEVAECVRVTGLRPVALLASLGVLGPSTTVVHATHVDDAEIAALADAGATVAVCPTTEADLGDGLVPAEPLLRRGVALALGTDSHASIDPFAEMRALEWHERLRTGRRNALVEPRRGAVGPTLLEAAAAGGARSLGLPTGGLRPGEWADWVTVDLDAPALWGWAPDTLVDMLAMHGHAGCIDETWVAGRRVVARGEHPAAASLRAHVRARPGSN